jgi:hypothetical protein
MGDDEAWAYWERVGAVGARWVYVTGWRCMYVWVVLM